jgi:hypothetical protein
MIPHSNTEAVRKAVLAELFGPNIRSVWEASVRGVQLPRHPTKELSAKKIKSLSAKYFSIPQEHLSYYPAVPEAILNAPEINTEHTETGDPNTDATAGKRKPGRPHKKKVKLPFCNSSALLRSRKIK